MGSGDLDVLKFDDDAAVGGRVLDAVSGLPAGLP